MKPRVFLDSTHPLTSSVPVKAGTSETWVERLDELMDLATELRFGDSKGKERAELLARYLSLREGVEFRDEPYFVKYMLLLGEEAAKKGGEVPDMIGCHPDVWALAPEEMKARYEVVDCDENRKKWAGTSITIPAIQEERD